MFCKLRIIGLVYFFCLTGILIINSNSYGTDIPEELEPLPVKFMSQGAGNKNCGPVCLVMAARYVLGGNPVQADVDKVNRYLRVTSADDKSTDQLVRAARADKVFGLSFVSSSKWTLDEIKKELLLGGPVIVGVNSSYLPPPPTRHYNYAGGHFVLVVGFTNDSIICHDPGSKQDAFISYPINNFKKAMITNSAPVVYGFMFYSKFINAMNSGNENLVYEMMSEPFQWANDPEPISKQSAIKLMDSSRDDSIKFNDNNINVWTGLSSLTDEVPQYIDNKADSSCPDGCYVLFPNKKSFGFVFKNINGQWKWAELRGD